MNCDIEICSGSIGGSGNRGSYRLLREVFGEYLRIYVKPLVGGDFWCGSWISDCFFGGEKLTRFSNRCSAAPYDKTPTASLCSVGRLHRIAKDTPSADLNSMPRIRYFLLCFVSNIG